MLKKILQKYREGELASSVKERIRFDVYLPARRFMNLVSDWYYHIDTENIASLDSLGVPADSGERYESTPASEFNAVMKSFNISPQDTFLDMGCGKGRTALLAGKYPFRKIIGVDISGILVKIAEHNVRSMQSRLRCKQYEFITSNAASYDIPADISYVYFFNPFPYHIMSKVMDNIRVSFEKSPRRITIIYYNPKYAEQLEQDPYLNLIDKMEFNHFSLYKSRCNIYDYGTSYPGISPSEV